MRVERAVRIAALEELRAAYPTFLPFLHDMMQEMGFTNSQIQDEIGEFLANGPDYLMIQAQRGQAKTTITAIFAVWCLIHNTQLRILIISAGETQANEISTLIVRLIQNVDILWPLRPDKAMGDRTATDAFDVNYQLKRLDKSPSVACFGIMGNAQGKRADLLIADDVESAVNSDTQAKREKLLGLTKDFTSMNTDGRIIYLGTPQSTDSIYNTLPGRGFTVRVWPGRLPNAAQIEAYGETLAPSVKALYEKRPDLATGYGLDGQQGIALDPRISDEVLVKKEMDQGPAYFQLQHMLLTALMDAQRYPLKTANIMLMRFSPENLPMTVTRGFGGPQSVVRTVGTKKFTFALPLATSTDTAPAAKRISYIDPAGGGQNGDETGVAHGSLLNSTIFVSSITGFPGGYDPDKLEAIAKSVLKFRPGAVVIEKNFGYGAFAVVFTPVLTRVYEEAGLADEIPAIEEEYVTNSKERRIIDTLEPVIGRGALVFHEDILTDEAVSLAKYDLRQRYTYSVVNQLSLITYEKDSLVHDDRLDALEGLVRRLSEGLVIDSQKAIEEARNAELTKWLRNPMGQPSHMLAPAAPSGFRARVRRL